MKLMDQIVEVGGGDVAPLPSFEMRPEIEESLAQLAVVGDGRPFSNKAFQSLRSVLHQQFVVCLPNYK